MVWPKKVIQKVCLSVSPNPVGLVGKCYNDKYAVYDDNLKINNANYGLKISD